MDKWDLPDGGCVHPSSDFQTLSMPIGALVYNCYLSNMSPEIIGNLLMILFWIFIVRGVVRFVKKIAGGAEQKPAAKTEKKEYPTLPEVIREMQRKIQEAEAQQNQNKNLPPVITKPENKPVAEKKIQPRPQTLYRQKDLIDPKIKQESADHEKFVEAERRKEHDARQSELEKKIYSIDQKEEPAPEFELDLRNAVLGSIILDRPYQ